VQELGTSFLFDCPCSGSFFSGLEPSLRGRPRSSNVSPLRELHCVFPLPSPFIKLPLQTLQHLKFSISFPLFFLPIDFWLPHSPFLFIVFFSMPSSPPAKPTLLKPSHAGNPHFPGLSFFLGSDSSTPENPPKSPYAPAGFNQIASFYLSPAPIFRDFPSCVRVS